MSVILSSVCALVSLWLCSKVFEFYKFVRKFDGIPRLQESFPFSLPLDMIISMNKTRKQTQKLKDCVKRRPIPRGKLMSRMIFKAFDVLMKDHIDEPIVLCFCGHVAVIHALMPEAIENILGNPKMIHKDFLHRFLKPWLGNGLFGHPGNLEWKNHRKMITPALHFRVLEDYTVTMNEAGAQLVDELSQQKSPINVLPIMRMCTFAILFETAMGIKVNKNDREHLQFLEDCDELADLIQERLLNFAHWPEFLFKLSDECQRTKAASDRISDYIYKVIDSKLPEFSMNNNEERQTFIDIVLKMHIDGLLTRENVRDEVATFIVGGFDTTATSISFTLHLLARHPEILRKLQAEIETVVGDEKFVTKEHLKKMPYIDAVSKESLRMFPPLPMVPRNVKADTRVGKHCIPAGTIAIVHTYHMQRNPNVWTKPNEFLPERFLEDVKRHPYSFVPFSAGPRNCIGQKFATQEDKILLAHIVRAFDLHTDDDTEKIRLGMELILRPIDGLLVEFSPRTQVAM